MNKNFQSCLYDHNGIFEFNKELYQKLFENNETGVFGYSESVKSFFAWWGGVYGKVAIESVFDDNKMNKVYRELSTSLNVKKRLKIDLIYNRLLLTENIENSWYAVLHIEDIFIPKRDQK